ncbi:uncharacterized protein K452DRAFT_118735 [Aplosporella prunicola CBS 121167]|uniref:Uncharacterized protein n=1 Tax=Aplosporella prunicola CBS 121167 TaxID=1176127 RepID=A0A6A6BNV0_9PEZI|nr:uncharacterized protein K452DRAFT_118735 [Aplosporella prunicola CBS 121167]KAF2145348.1 hypothetical protein K452DRAFT_118735 [Aplosporella prunicola CBS 121167]
MAKSKTKNQNTACMACKACLSVRRQTSSVKRQASGVGKRVRQRRFQIQLQLIQKEARKRKSKKKRKRGPIEQPRKATKIAAESRAHASAPIPLIPLITDIDFHSRDSRTNESRPHALPMYPYPARPLTSTHAPTPTHPSINHRSRTHQSPPPTCPQHPNPSHPAAIPAKPNAGTHHAQRTRPRSPIHPNGPDPTRSSVEREAGRRKHAGFTHSSTHLARAPSVPALPCPDLSYLVVVV